MQGTDHAISRVRNNNIKQFVLFKNFKNTQFFEHFNRKQELKPSFPPDFLVTSFNKSKA